MTYLRATIDSVNIKSVKCRIGKREITKQEANKYESVGMKLHPPKYGWDSSANAISTASSLWIRSTDPNHFDESTTPIKATFKFVSTKLYDTALSYLNTPVILRVENGQIHGILPVTVHYQE
jgi:hypothetical protein